MKKIAATYLASIVLVLGLFTGIASAQVVIDNTGPGSDNEVIIDNDSSVNCDNNTDIDIDVDTDQDAGSGDADNNGNTNGGGASSGDANNNNDVDAEVNVDNECVGDSDTDTPPTPVTPTTPTVPYAPTGGGNVLGETTPDLAVLPNTAGTSPLALSVMSGVAIAAAAVVVRGLRTVINR